MVHSKAVKIVRNRKRQGKRPSSCARNTTVCPKQYSAHCYPSHYIIVIHIRTFSKVANLFEHKHGKEMVEGIKTQILKSHCPGKNQSYHSPLLPF